MRKISDYNKEVSPEQLQHDQEIFNQIKFGCTKPSPDDDRDFLACTLATVSSRNFPKSYIAPQTEILDQGVYSSCVAHACATAMAQGEELAWKDHNIYSRGYIYGNRKSTDMQSEGMIIRQALKQLHNCGDVFYEDFPYNRSYYLIKKLIEAEKEELAEKALPNAIVDFYRCYSKEQIKSAILDTGSVIICVPVYSNFGRDLHKPEEKAKPQGYHAMVIIGWTEDNRWIVQNSWGSSWGYNGTLLMDSDYPVNEYWGLTVKAFLDRKKSVWQKFKELCSGIWNWIKQLFNKNSK